MSGEELCLSTCENQVLLMQSFGMDLCKGINGFCEYLEYLIAEKGLKGGLIEGKVSVLIDTIGKE